MAFSDFYPEGHQSGATVILNGVGVAANGDVRLEPTPGQWQPIPKLDQRTVDANQQVITTLLSYPDPSRNRKGFNPIEYPDRNGWALGRVMPLLNDPNFASEVRGALVKLRDRIDQQVRETPFGMPYRPNIWGAGWEIQSFGAAQVFLHKGWPDIFDATALFNAHHFVLGCHPDKAHPTC